MTAGNASGINDGAAALLIGSTAAGGRLGLNPRGRIVSAAIAGVAPRVMGLGPVPASKKALERAGLTLADIDVIEINEAFATQVLGCLVGLDLASDDSRVNPNGGAIAVGHPLGASGARLALTALRQLERIAGTLRARLDVHRRGPRDRRGDRARESRVRARGRRGQANRLRRARPISEGCPPTPSNPATSGD